MRSFGGLGVLLAYSDANRTPVPIQSGQFSDGFGRVSGLVRNGVRYRPDECPIRIGTGVRFHRNTHFGEAWSPTAIEPSKDAALVSAIACLGVRSRTFQRAAGGCFRALERHSVRVFGTVLPLPSI